jgi:lipopolysaccharide export system protein LptA
VRSVSQIPGQPDKVGTSEAMEARFTPEGALASVEQVGNFQYAEAESSPNEPGGRHGSSARASFNPADDSITLLGSPRVVDGGVTVTAETIRLTRRSSEAVAQGNVKTTYSELKVQPGGALLATADPVHVTAQTMNAAQLTGVAHYSGGARLWQGSNIVEGRTIDFDQHARSIVATGERRHPVSSVFVQVDAKGRSSTVVVTAPRLTYADNEREARYSGGVTVRAESGVMTADHAEVFLNAAGASHAVAAPSQLDHIVAGAHVVVQQQERRAEGDKLVYTAADSRFVMTGGPPVMSDPVNGTVRGNSLTFFSRDDRVIVEGDGGSRTVTHTHVSR